MTLPGRAVIRASDAGFANLSLLARAQTPVGDNTDDDEQYRQRQVVRAQKFMLQLREESLVAGKRVGARDGREPGEQYQC